MAGRIPEHVRRHWVAYVVGFIALSGTAIAADGPLPGQNRVGSADIINSEVVSADVRNNSLRGPDIANDAVTGTDVDESSLGTVPRSTRANNSAAVDGKDFSDLRAQTLFNSFGPLPLQTTYLSDGGSLYISLAGSGFRGTGSSQKEGLIGMRLLIDGTVQHIVDVYTNERNSHKAFVSGQEITSVVPAGAHEIRLEEAYSAGSCNTGSEQPSHYCTATDANDVFQVSVLEIPDGP